MGAYDHLSPPPVHKIWHLSQVMAGPGGVVCEGCYASVTIDRRTLQVVEIESGMIDLPHAALPPPTTTAEEALRRFREMRPADDLARPPRVHLSYAQDVFGDVGLVWEIAVRRSCHAQGGDSRSRSDVQWVALDARNLAIRGYDMGNDDRFSW